MSKGLDQAHNCLGSALPSRRFLMPAVSAVLCLFSLGGCAQTTRADFSPPPGGETVSVSVKVPKDLTANTMRVMYRSEKCPISRSDGDGNRFEIEGAHTIEVEPQRQGQSDLYEAQLARNGGGICQWKLSNVTFGVHYQNTARFGQNVQAGRGGGVIVIFDRNQPQRRSLLKSPTEVKGDLMIKRDYYPWVDEEFLGQYEKQIRLVGDDDFFLTFKALSARRVSFEPVLHADYVVESAGPKVKQEGSHTRFIYPDGSVEADGKSKPSFKKLQAIRSGGQP